MLIAFAVGFGIPMLYVYVFSGLGSFGGLRHEWAEVVFYPGLIVGNLTYERIGGLVQGHHQLREHVAVFAGSFTMGLLGALVSEMGLLTWKLIVSADEPRR